MIFSMIMRNMDETKTGRKYLPQYEGYYVAYQRYCGRLPMRRDEGMMDGHVNYCRAQRWALIVGAPLS